ncbi:uncharacterized protein [Drosophila takahashii]|uniref:uncharacterized protein n=1 Tax=Drosophila takahashii TaxID=29030 RepID=UPI0038990A4C
MEQNIVQPAAPMFKVEHLAFLRMFDSEMKAAMDFLGKMHLPGNSYIPAKIILPSDSDGRDDVYDDSDDSDGKGGDRDGKGGDSDGKGGDSDGKGGDGDGSGRGFTVKNNDDRKGGAGDKKCTEQIDKKKPVGVNKNDWYSSALAFAKEIVFEFSGQAGVHNWIKQLENVSNLYQLSDMQQHLLCIGKLKGDALQWLHADPNRISMPVGVLLEDLALAFGGKMSKAEQRRVFESRVWKPEERFTVYYDDKMMLAREINIDMEELLDGLIEGIPMESMRIQARVQCFQGPTQMLRAFAQISLPKKRVMSSVKVEKERSSFVVPKDSRCHNCNSKGHWAKDCWKPKRVPGSCYACGEMGHMVAECKMKKSGDVNQYKAS